jgi:DNA topoisomerase IB
MPRLRRVDCSTAGIARRPLDPGDGSGDFEYLAVNGSRLTDADELARIVELAIPPAWRDVWISPYPNGHLQAVGIDARGRRQYLYHPDWRTRRDSEKFERMLDFARALPTVRRVCAEQLRGTGLTRSRVLACAVRLLDRGFFRIGTEAYAVENETYGLATMRKEHVTLDGDVLRFDYIAKGSKRRVQSVVDPEVAAVVAALKRRRGGGPELLAYRADSRAWVDVSSRDINEHVKAIVGEGYSAKDFRTWNATVLAAVALAVSGPAARSPSARKRAISRAVQEVAHYLGNTPAVARKSYIDPRVFDRYLSGWTISGVLEELGIDTGYGEPSTQGAVEDAVVDLLEYNRASPAVERVTALT